MLILFHQNPFLLIGKIFEQLNRENIFSGHAKEKKTTQKKSNNNTFFGDTRLTSMFSKEFLNIIS